MDSEEIRCILTECPYGAINPCGDSLDRCDQLSGNGVCKLRGSEDIRYVTGIFFRLVFLCNHSCFIVVHASHPMSKCLTVKEDFYIALTVRMRAIRNGELGVPSEDHCTRTT